MKFSPSVVAFIIASASCGSVSAFQPAAVVVGKSLSRSHHVTTSNSPTGSSSHHHHTHGCACASCTKTGCKCSACTTRLSSTVDDAAVPEQVEAMDGVESEEEAHNVERPARQSIAKKKAATAKPLSEFTVGETVTGTVKTVTSYGAFLDIGGETDGLLHISNLSSEFVSDVSEVLTAGQPYQVRILEINQDKKQVALTMLSEDDEAKQQEANNKRQTSNNNRRASNSNTNDLLDKLRALDIDQAKFVAGKVVNTVDFGAFVRVDCSQFSDEITGSLDGLVHISALTNARVSTVTDVVKEGQDVQVRLKGIDGSKVSLSMVSVEEEQTKMDTRGSGSEVVDMGNQEWRQDYEKLKATMPEFRNGPVIINK